MIETKFPVGFHEIHPDVSLNFQLNRWFGWVGEEAMLDEMRRVAPRIRDYADWKREFVALAVQAEAGEHLLRAAFYWRAADFFMMPKDADRSTARHRFLELTDELFAPFDVVRHRVPYAQGNLSGSLNALMLKSVVPSADTIVFFGGFDSYIEELLPSLNYLRDAGFDVIAFEGPGQGSTLHDGNLPMTPDWAGPLGVILDHFRLQSCTLVGLSLGGCLALRAAAEEPRVQRVVAYDVLTDFLAVSLRQTPVLVRVLLRGLLQTRAAAAVNLLARVAARRSPVLQWGLAQGMNVTGTRTPYSFLREVKRYRTTDISHRVAQDVLLMAGADDHFVPVAQLTDQLRTLTTARSTTARLFTPHESASSHCQVGNYRLALDVIVDWLRAMRLEDAHDGRMSKCITSSRAPSFVYNATAASSP